MNENSIGNRKRPRGRPKKPEGAATPAQRKQASRDRMKALKESLAGKGYVTVPLVMHKDRADAITQLAKEFDLSVMTLLSKAADTLLTGPLMVYSQTAPEARQELLRRPEDTYRDIEWHLHQLLQARHANREGASE